MSADTNILVIRHGSADIGAIPLPATVKPEVPAKLVEPTLQPTDGTSCKQNIRISVFFDGTGNNLKADVPDIGHSNVAKLFRAHPESDDALSAYAIYVPGIGTYFKEIDDKGGASLDGGTLGLGVARYGQQRLDWAFQQVQELISSCDARTIRSPAARVENIRIAVFGFSRGAAQARAFCRDLAKMCPGELYLLPSSRRKVPIEVDFLGLFDTVASVGLPTSANTVISKVSASVAAVDNPVGIAVVDDDPLKELAFGEPGAAPATGSNDGHYSWGKNIGIGPIVKKCLHLVAAHEWRNSFPLDSALAGSAYPASVTEIVMPGSHSDVGGGYEPCEGGKSRRPGSLISLIPLWIMFEAAGKVVPFYRMKDFAGYNHEDFGTDPKSRAGFEAMSASYNHYLKRVKDGGGLGKTVLEHKRLYFAWRFRAIARSPSQAKQNLADKQSAADRSALRVKELEDAKALHNQRGWPWPESAESSLRDAQRQSMADQQALARARSTMAQAGRDDNDIAQGEADFALARERLENDARAKRTAAYQAKLEVGELEQRKLQSARMGVQWSPEREDQLKQAHQKAAELDDAYLQARARLDTKADDRKLLANIRKYDSQLMEDADRLRAWVTKNPNLKLRPHYKAMLEAYRDEFERNAGLRDASIIDFFDHYVHDSLAGFAHDDTRASDPRIIYVGADTRLMYARSAPVEEQAPITA
ncbi:hypothetical protein BH11PSE9_BH11PSE9_09590 [soil metagenome]